MLFRGFFSYWLFLSIVLPVVIIDYFGFFRLCLFYFRLLPYR
jgi:hypothetical protein